MSTIPLFGFNKKKREVPVEFKEANIKAREQAIKKYYESPNYCLHCHKIIEIKENQKVSEARHKRFCNSSCYGFYTNKNTCRNHHKKIRLCRVCLTIIEGKGKYCSGCREIILYRNRSHFEKRTKGELFASRKNWQSARSGIVKHANSIYAASGQPRRCCICGYDKHFQVAHRRPVSDFPDEALIGDINNIRNLMPLCPNHHWERDHGQLMLDPVPSKVDASTNASTFYPVSSIVKEPT